MSSARLGRRAILPGWAGFVFYRHQVSPNVALISGLLVVRNPENNRDRGSIWIGSLRSIPWF